MTVTCAHCGREMPKKKMFRNKEDSLNFPNQWVCLDTVRCADARYARDKQRGVFSR